MLRRTLPLALTVIVAVTACGGGGDETADAKISTGVVIDPDEVAAARERIDSEDEIEAASADTTVPTGEGSDAGEAGSDEPAPETTVDTLPVAEAEEDELDSLLNSLTVFNQCLSDDGFEFIGAPGIAGATADQFDEPYLQSLGKCATSSNVVQAFQDYGSAQENRSPEAIAAYNFGLPVFRECMIGRGWKVGELVPDAKGALGFGTELSPPPGSDGFGTDDVADCRLEAEQYVADNYDPEA
jgi:hypothetical protein